MKTIFAFIEEWNVEVTVKPSDKEGMPREKWRTSNEGEGKRGRERRKEGIKFILSLR